MTAASLSEVNCRLMALLLRVCNKLVAAVIAKATPLPALRFPFSRLWHCKVWSVLRAITASHERHVVS